MGVDGEVNVQAKYAVGWINVPREMPAVVNTQMNFQQTLRRGIS